MQSATVQNVEKAPAHLTATILGMWQLNPVRYFYPSHLPRDWRSRPKGQQRRKVAASPHLTLTRRIYCLERGSGTTARQKSETRR